MVPAFPRLSVGIESWPDFLPVRLPAVTVELEAAPKAPDAAFHLGELARLGAVRAYRLVVARVASLLFGCRPGLHLPNSEARNHGELRRWDDGIAAQRTAGQCLMESMRRRAVLSFLLVAVSTGACATRAPMVSVSGSAPGSALATEGVADSGDLIGPGCYDCLVSALDEARSSTTATFEVAALLVLRSKELGLPFEAWLEQASTAMPPGAEWLSYLEIISLVRVDPLSGDREAILAATLQQRRRTATVVEWREALRSGTASRLFRTYLDLTLACSLGEDEWQRARAGAEQDFANVPLVQYRIGTCRTPTYLEGLAVSQPAFVDVELPLGRNALDAERPDQEEALRRFRKAAVAFSASALVHASIGAVHRAREEWAAALDAYDTTLRLVPTHRDALLGRAVALSNLSRHVEAVETSTRLLELGNWFIGGGYFWRAWNNYHLGNIAAARSDLDLAKARGTSAEALALSGLVAWRQQQLDVAEAEFTEAIRTDGGQCEAAAFLGGVQTAQERWADAAGSLRYAEQCFDLSIALRRKLIDGVKEGPGTLAGKAQQVARHEEAVRMLEQNRDEVRRDAAGVEDRLP